MNGSCRNIYTGLQFPPSSRRGPITAWTGTVNGMIALRVYVLFIESYGHDCVLLRARFKGASCCVLQINFIEPDLEDWQIHTQVFLILTHLLSYKYRIGDMHIHIYNRLPFQLYFYNASSE